jgi:hypothetical protein
MTSRPATGILLPVVLVLTLFLAASASAQAIHAVYGEDIPLGGRASGTDFLYLFLTGPNLPGQGISLVGGTPVTTGVPASFTRVEVQTDGTWTYTWQTRSLGRLLDPGTYTIYAAEEARSRPDLDDTVYSLLPVTFGPPVETVTVTFTVATTGSLSIDSSPEMSPVVLDGKAAGITPLMVSDVPPGTHTIVISRPGYADYRANITLSAGERREISPVLLPLSGTSPTPSAATPPSTTSPGRLAPPALVPLAAAVVAILGFRRR